MKRKHKLILKILLGLLVIFFAIPLINIYWYNEPDELDPKHPKEYGVVFGAAIRSKGRLSGVLKDRMDDAIKLYKEGKVRYLILSGAKYKQMPPGEPKAMRKYAISKGVKAADISLDERGDRSYLTVQYASYLRKLNPNASFVFISSPYHMFRIRFLTTMMHIPQAYYYFTPKTIPFYSKEMIREVFAFWFYVAYRIAYAFR